MNTNYNISVTFAENKIVNFRTWLGRERRLLQKILEGTLDGKVEDILVYNCMETKVYLSRAEITYAIFILFSKSFENNIYLQCVCNSCNHVNDKTINLDSVVNTAVLPSIPNLDYNNYNITFSNNNSLTDTFFIKQQNTELDSDKVFNEVCGHISEIFVDKEEVLFKSFDEMSAYLDNIDIDLFDKIFNNYILNTFVFIPSIEYKCENPECNFENYEIIDIIDEMVSRFMV